jgi:hypothetical protein
MPRRSNTDEFVVKAQSIHGDWYDYHLVQYINSHTKIKIICPLHGLFEQIPNSHLAGQGRPKCIHIISSPEIDWLDMVNIAPENRNISLPGLGRKRVDGYDPNTNTVYEFHGDYWHGNPEKFDPSSMNERAKMTFGELYARTIEREALIKSAGYSLVTIWKSQLKQLIKGAAS